MLNPDPSNKCHQNDRDEETEPQGWSNSQVKCQNIRLCQQIPAPWQVVKWNKCGKLEFRTKHSTNFWINKSIKFDKNSLRIRKSSSTNATLDSTYNVYKGIGPLSSIEVPWALDITHKETSSSTQKLLASWNILDMLNLEEEINSHSAMYQGWDLSTCKAWYVGEQVIYTWRHCIKPLWTIRNIFKITQNPR